MRQGTLRDAILFSVSANASHGLRRTNEDKRRAVLTLLNDPTWVQWSDREIARHCRVGADLVGKMRPQVVTVVSDSEPAYFDADRYAVPVRIRFFSHVAA